jgi:hypothetical protein
MRVSPQAIADDLRRFERICLEQAELCVLEEARAALRSLARNYGDAVTAIEKRDVLGA